MTLLFIYLTIAIGVSFLCSVLEAVLLSLTPSYVEQIAIQKPRRGKTVARVKHRLDESISGILILNTFAHTIGAVGVGIQATNVFGAEWEMVIAVLLTLTILYVSEIIPKTIGAVYWRQLALPSAYVISLLVKLVYPLVLLSTFTTRLFSKNQSHEITREEIMAMASLGHKSGTLASQENEYLANVLRLGEIHTKQILTPRTVMYSLDQEMTVSQALEEKTKQFSRIPIYKNDNDDITGMVIIRDLLFAEREDKGHSSLRNFAKPIHRVSENLPVQQLLDLFIKRQDHMFLVEDQFGQTAGVVTLEDAIETLLGREIVDESDTVEDLQVYAKDKYRDRLRGVNNKPNSQVNKQE